MSWNESEEVAARRGQVGIVALGCRMPRHRSLFRTSQLADAVFVAPPTRHLLYCCFCSGNVVFFLSSPSSLRLLAMFKHSVMRAASRPLLRPANQANNTFRASPSTFYLVDRLQSKRGYATETGMGYLRAGLYCTVQN